MTYPPQQSYGHPGQPPRPKRTNRTLLIIIGSVVGVFLLLCLCGLVVALATGDDEPDALPTPVTPTTITPTTPAVPTSQALPSLTAAPTSAAPEVITMPDVTGENAAVADDRLRKLGFTNLQFGSQDKNDTLVIMLANWTVTKQSTKAGQKVAADTLIVLTCTKQ